MTRTRTNYLLKIKEIAFLLFFFKNNFFINGFESLYFVHYHLHSSAVCTEDEADEEISIHIFHWKLMNKECC